MSAWKWTTALCLSVLAAGLMGWWLPWGGAAAQTIPTAPPPTNAPLPPRPTTAPEDPQPTPVAPVGGATRAPVVTVTAPAKVNTPMTAAPTTGVISATAQSSVTAPAATALPSVTAPVPTTPPAALTPAATPSALAVSPTVQVQLPVLAVGQPGQPAAEPAPASNIAGVAAVLIGGGLILTGFYWLVRRKSSS